MMAYIQILAIVLCSCVIQDAFSTRVIRRSRSVPANDGVALANAEEQTAPSRPAKRTVSKKSTAVSEPPPPPPAKYPHLTAVKDMFWNTFEDINSADLNGKLDIRAVRNTVSNVLSNQLFWTSVVGAIKRRVKITNDSDRADKKIQKCNTLTAAVTSPYAMQEFQDIANEVYGTVSRIQTNAGSDTLRLVTERVNDGDVTRGLDTITDFVTSIKLSPKMLSDVFNTIHKTLNMGGAINMGGGLAKGLVTFTSQFSK